MLLVIAYVETFLYAIMPTLVSLFHKLGFSLIWLIIPLAAYYPGYIVSASNAVYPSKRGMRYVVHSAVFLVLNVISLILSFIEHTSRVHIIANIILYISLIYHSNKADKQKK